MVKHSPKIITSEEKATTIIIQCTEAETQAGQKFRETDISAE